MLIQLHGGGFDNRGAQLMLWTAIQKLQQYQPSTRFAMEATRSTYRECASYGLLTLAPSLDARRPRRTRFLIGTAGLASRMLPPWLEQQYGIARRCDVDALVDISGYSFGDKWGAMTARAMTARIRHFERRGKPTVLLPQMFGPFEKRETIEAFQPILDHVGKIYVRDPQSYDWLNKINETGRPIDIAPDITIFCEPVAAEETPGFRYACLVPNMRMRDKAQDTWGSDYMDAMIEAAQRLNQLDIRPYLVIHDGGEEDIVLGREIAARASLQERQIYREADPRKIKGFIRGAELLIGSRFHALVAALSSGTPAIAIGWAHKYEALMDDFGVAEYCCSDHPPASRLRARIRVRDIAKRPRAPGNAQ